MKRFRKILVGVDFSWCDRFVFEDLSAANAETVRPSLWLAKLNSSSVDFFSSSDLSTKAQRLVSESNTDESTVLDEAKARLAESMVKSRAEGVVACSQVVVGKNWLALIRLVLWNEHDLVLVGTHHMGTIKGFFLGSTGIKLLEKCPFAVWVTPPILRPRPCQGVRA